MCVRVRVCVCVCVCVCLCVCVCFVCVFVCLRVSVRGFYKSHDILHSQSDTSNIQCIVGKGTCNMYTHTHTHMHTHTHAHTNTHMHTYAHTNTHTHTHTLTSSFGKTYINKALCSRAAWVHGWARRGAEIFVLDSVKAEKGREKRGRGRREGGSRATETVRTRAKAKEAEARDRHTRTTAHSHHHISTKETYVSTKEPYTSAKELRYIHRRALQNYRRRKRACAQARWRTGKRRTEINHRLC